MCWHLFSLCHKVSDGPGCIANKAGYLKKGKYASIEATYHLMPIGIETTGVFGSEANCFLHELGVCLKIESSDPRAYHFLLQRIGIAIQHGMLQLCLEQAQSVTIIILKKLLLLLLLYY